MVGIVYVSHSPKIAEGLKEMAVQMVFGDALEQMKIEAVGGTKDGRIGTDVEAIKNAIQNVMGPDGVAVLVDIGSAVISVEMAQDELDDSERALVRIADAPLVEGAVLATTQAGLGSPLSEVIQAAEDARTMNKLD